MDSTATNAVQPFAALCAFEMLPCTDKLHQSVSQSIRLTDTVVIKDVQLFATLPAFETIPYNHQLRQSFSQSEKHCIKQTRPAASYTHCIYTASLRRSTPLVSQSARQALQSSKLFSCLLHSLHMPIPSVRQSVSQPNRIYRYRCWLAACYTPCIFDAFLTD